MRGVSFADGLVGPVGGAGTSGWVGTIGASVTASAGAGGTASGVAGNEVSALVSASAAFRRCHRLGSIAWGSVTRASDDMRSLMCWASAETSSFRVLGSHFPSGVLRTAQALGVSWGYACGVKGALPWLRNAGWRRDLRCWRVPRRASKRGWGGTGARLGSGASRRCAGAWSRPACETAGRRRVPARARLLTTALRTAPPSRRTRRAPIPWRDWEGRPAGWSAIGIRGENNRYAVPIQGPAAR